MQEKGNLNNKQVNLKHIKFTCLAIHLENIPQPHLHLPAGREVWAGSEGAGLGGIELIDRLAVTIDAAIGHRLKVTGSAGIFTEPPFAADEVADVDDIQADLDGLGLRTVFEIKILEDPHVGLAE